MPIRFEEADNAVKTVLAQVRSEYFPELRNAKIITLFDTKRRVSGGRIVLAKIMKANDLIRLLTQDDDIGVEGVDYIITIDKVAWNAIESDDWHRIIRHELRHCEYDIEAEENPYDLICHDLEDFVSEVKLNQDDPDWRQRVANLTADIYEQEKDDKKGKKQKRHAAQGNLC
jgi:hypothetical protein